MFKLSTNVSKISALVFVVSAAVILVAVVSAKEILLLPLPVGLEVQERLKINIIRMFSFI